MEKERPHYETAIVILLAVVLGIVFLNRLAIVFLFPFIIDEFKITYAQAGSLVSIIGLTFAFSTWFFGGLSDRFGKKVILIPATVVLSLMSWVSGIAQGFVQMLLARGVMGLGGGAVPPPSIAAILMESTPRRRGLNFGIHQALNALISFGVCAIVVTQLTRIMSWRMVLFVVGIPGLIAALILFLYMREPGQPVWAGQGHEAGSAEKAGVFFAPLKYRNVKVSSIVNSCLLGTLMVFTAFGVTYLTRDLGLSIAKAGIVMSFTGVGAFFGTILLPLLSDHTGRKPVLISAMFGTGLCFAGFLFGGFGFAILALLLFLVGFAVGGVIPLAMSALPTEDVPPHMAATASGIAACFGEILGGACMPLLAGLLADSYGLKAGILLAVIAPLAGGLAGFFYRETAPRIVEKRAGDLSAPARGYARTVRGPKGAG